MLARSIASAPSVDAVAHWFYVPPPPPPPPSLKVYLRLTDLSGKLSLPSEMKKLDAPLRFVFVCVLNYLTLALMAVTYGRFLTACGQICPPQICSCFLKISLPIIGILCTRIKYWCGYVTLQPDPCLCVHFQLTLNS